MARRWWLLGLAVVLAAVSARYARQLDFDRSLENMFAEDDPLLPPYEKLKATFGGNEVVIAAYRDEDLFADDHSGLARLRAVTEEVEAVPGVDDVLAIEKLLRLSESNRGGDDSARYLSLDGGQAQRLRELFAGYTHSGEGDIAALAVMLVPEQETETPRRETIDALREIMSKQPEGLITGEPVMVVDGFRYVEEDGVRLAWWSTILLGLTILLCFQSIRWVVIPLATVWVTLLMTQGFLVATGIPLSMVSSMLTAIVTVVVVATVIHVTVHFREARLEGKPPADAMRWAIARLARPILFTCITDAIGFCSLLVAQVGPVKDFGLMMAAGSLMVLVSAPLVVPGLALAGRFDADPKRAWGEGNLDSALTRIIDWVLNGPRWLWVGAFLVLLIAATGVARLEVESDFTRNFRRESPIVVSYEFVEDNLGGAGVWDIMVPAPEELDWEYLEQIDKLQQRLRDEVTVSSGPREGEAALTKVISLQDAVVAGSPLDIEGMRLEWAQNRAVGMGLGLMRIRLPAFVDALHGEDTETPDRHWYRIMLRSYERQSSSEKEKIIAQVRTIVDEEMQGEYWQEHLPESETAEDYQPQITGFYVLLTHLIGSVIADQWLTFAVATLGIGLMTALAFRSIPIALVALVPNTLPILVVMGLMGWSGLPVNMGAAMIAAVSMGLSIDSSIHYIESFRLARSAGASVPEALLTVQHTTGRAMVFSTLALIVGFGALRREQLRAHHLLWRARRPRHARRTGRQPLHFAPAALAHHPRNRR